MRSPLRVMGRRRPPFLSPTPPISDTSLSVPRSSRSVSPVSPGVSKEDTLASAREWVRNSLVAIDPDTRPQVQIKKAEVFARYSVFISQGVEDGVAEATLGKYIKEIFPNAATRRTGARGSSQYCYEGIQWADAPPPSPQRQQRDWGKFSPASKPPRPLYEGSPGVRGDRLHSASPTFSRGWWIRATKRAGESCSSSPTPRSPSHRSPTVSKI